EIVGAQLAGHPGPDPVRVALGQDEELVGRVHRAWPLLQATDVLADLYEVPAYLRRCAPSLSGADRRLLQREEPRRWTLADLPLLDALRHRLGDPGTEARRLRQRAGLPAALGAPVARAGREAAAAGGAPALAPRGPASPGRPPAPPRRSRHRGPSAPAAGRPPGDRRGDRADGRLPHRQRQLRDEGD